MLLYGTVDTKLTLNDCVFNDKGDDTITNKAAIEIGNDYDRSYELVINNIEVNGFAVTEKKSEQGGDNLGTNVWGNKNLMPQSKLNVIIDRLDVY